MIIYKTKDNSGEESVVVRRSSELSEEEINLLKNGQSMDNEESVKELVKERAAEIKANTALAKTYTEFLAGEEYGLTLSETADIFDREYGAIASAKQQVVDKWEGYQWMEEEKLDEVIANL